MKALQFWKAVTKDKADFLGTLVRLLEENSIRYCVIGGQGVNAYAEPVVSLDLDLAVLAEQIVPLEALFRRGFKVKRFANSVNVSAEGSQLRVQIQTDPRYAAFVARATPRDVLDLTLPVAAIEDVLQGKVWAASDPTRRASKRQKDLADIARLLEVRPDLRGSVPSAILDRLV
jgi:hypothetical protein